MPTDQFDLHIHTYFSDGKDSPTDLLVRAKRNFLRLVSLTDHNSMNNVAKEISIAKKLKINFLPGIELSSVYEGKHVHLLGYGYDFKNAEIKKIISGVQKKRARDILKIAGKLRQQGFEIYDSELKSLPAEYFGLIHIIRILMEKPQEKKRIIKEVGGQDIFAVINHYFSAAKEAYILEDYLPAVKVIKLIKRAGGITSLAHPGSHLRYRDDHLISSLKTYGLDALEVFTPKHNWDQIVHYELLSKRLHLAVTAGSNYHEDFHQQDIPIVTPIGFLKTPPRVLQDLLKFLKSKIKYSPQF